MKNAKPRLLFKPYRAPNVKIGDLIFCERHGGDVEIAGMTTSPIPWPAYAGLTGRLTPILNGDLARAVRQESACAISYWWGVNRKTVTRWRRILGVARFTAGTSQLWKDLVDTRLTRESRLKGARALREKAKAR